MAGGATLQLIATITSRCVGRPHGRTARSRPAARSQVHYEPARLSHVRRATRGGYPQYGISGDYSINGGAAQSFETGHAEAGKLVASDATIDLPSSGDLALWFETTSTYGCHGYDSSNGANYHFPIQ